MIQFVKKRTRAMVGRPWKEKGKLANSMDKIPVPMVTENQEGVKCRMVSMNRFFFFSSFSSVWHASVVVEVVELSVIFFWIWEKRKRCKNKGRNELIFLQILFSAGFILSEKRIYKSLTNEGILLLAACQKVKWRIMTLC